MRQWWKRVRAAGGIALLWGVMGLGFGGLIELIDNVAPGALPIAKRLDMWPQTMAMVFFLGALVFTVLVGIAERHRRVDELSIPRFAAWGALAGLALGLVLGAPLAFLAITTIGSAVAASGSLAFARMAERGKRLPAGSDDPRPSVSAGRETP